MLLERLVHIASVAYESSARYLARVHDCRYYSPWKRHAALLPCLEGYLNLSFENTDDNLDEVPDFCAQGIASVTQTMAGLEISVKINDDRSGSGNDTWGISLHPANLI